MGIWLRLEVRALAKCAFPRFPGVIDFRCLTCLPSLPDVLITLKLNAPPEMGDWQAFNMRGIPEVDSLASIFLSPIPVPAPLRKLVRHGECPVITH